MPINAERRKKLSELLPEGVITIPSWLIENGFKRTAIDNLVKSGILTAIHHGVYVRGSATLQWQSIVYSLQSILQMDIVIGGLTSLEMQGFSHYLSFSETKKARTRVQASDSGRDLWRSNRPWFQLAKDYRLGNTRLATPTSWGSVTNPLLAAERRCWLDPLPCSSLTGDAGHSSQAMRLCRNRRR